MAVFLNGKALDPGAEANLVDAGGGLVQLPGQTGAGSQYYQLINTGGSQTLVPAENPALTNAAATSAAAAPSYLNPQSTAQSGISNANTGFQGSQGFILPNGTVVPVGQLSDVVNAVQAALGGNVYAESEVEQWAQAAGVTNPQVLRGMGSVIQDIASGKYQSVQGANGQGLYRSPNGQYFTIDPATGQRTAATQEQLAAGQYPVLAGYDAQGNPYYQPYQAPSPAALNLQQAQKNAATPEAAAWEAVKATDPNLAQSVQQLQSYYNDTLRNASTPQNLQGAMQSYLNVMDTLDPKSKALRDTMANSYASDINNANAGQLPAGVAQQVAESARGAQTARGNALGTAQSAQEAMATGLTGLQIRQQALQNAQSWLSSGLTTGQQAQQAYQYGQGAGNTAAGNTVSYLGSGQTPYGLGTGQLANIQNQATSSNQQTQYQPTYSGGPNYSYINPNAGSEFAQGSNQFFNSMVNQNLGTASIKSQEQANTYGLIGSIIGGVSKIAGAALGGA